MTRREKGENYFKKGFNCAQAVALAFSDKIGLDENTIAKLISPFGLVRSLRFCTLYKVDQNLTEKPA